MSYRFLYRKIPTEKRICSYYRCQLPILRNLAVDKETGLIYHYGCLQTAKDEHYRCLDCHATLDGREIGLADYQGSEPVKICGRCGSPNMRGLMWREKAELYMEAKT